MLSYVISIPYFIALHSTHTALQLPQSPLLPWRKNISFPANSYPLKGRKFHTLARGRISNCRSGRNEKDYRSHALMKGKSNCKQGTR